MTKKTAVAVIGAIALLTGSLAHAKKEKEPNAGGVSPQHMSTSGQGNANSPTMGQDKGAIRADDRKSDQGLAHDSDGKKDSKGKAKGHAK